VVGVSVVGIELLFIWMLGPGLPQWSLFTYLIVAFLIGLAYIGGEIMFSPIRRLLVDRDKIADPLWKRSLRLLALLSIVGVLVLVGVLLKERG